MARNLRNDCTVAGKNRQVMNGLGFLLSTHFLLLRKYNYIYRMSCVVELNILFIYVVVLLFRRGLKFSLYICMSITRG